MERKLFLSQLRAVLRVSAFGKVRLLLPMVTGVDEILEVRRIIKNIKEEFLEKRIDFAKDIPLGAMIEVPAAAASCSLLAAELDFLSIGSNDLFSTQMQPTGKITMFPSLPADTSRCSSADSLVGVCCQKVGESLSFFVRNGQRS